MSEIGFNVIKSHMKPSSFSLVLVTESSKYAVNHMIYEVESNKILSDNQINV